MAMTFDNLKKRIGKLTQLYDDTNGWKVGRDVTETDVGEVINDIYVNEIFPLFASQYPEDFRQVALADSWLTNGTAAAGLTGSTLTATSGIFQNSMVGLTVYNTTDSTSQIITGYTSSTVVTTDATDISLWSNDSIYVLGQEFAFAGDASDIFEIEAVGIKYSTSDQYFRIARQVKKFDFFQDGGELGAQLIPQYYRTSVEVSGVLKTAIGLVPGFTNKLSNAIQVNYIAVPPYMSAVSDTPRLNNIDLALISGGLERVFRLMQDEQGASPWQSKFQQDKMLAIQRYKPMNVDGGIGIKLPRKVTLMARRLI